MDNFDRTTGVLDSWDLLYPVSRTFVHRNKESVQFNKLNLLSASASFFIKEPSYNPVLNSISAGYYPVFGGFYKSCPSTYVRPLIQVTVCPKSHITVANAHKRRERPKKISTDKSGQSKKVYIVLPSNKKEKVCIIDTSNAEIFKEINDNKLLSECLKESYFKDMNRTKKKSPDKAKEQESQLQTIPECSPGCAYMNIMNKTKNVSPDRLGPPSPQSPVRSNYEMSTKVESMIKKQTINNQSTSQRHTSKKPDKNSLKSDDARPKSPTRTSQQKTRIQIYQSGKHQKDETPQSPERFSLRSKRSVESVISEKKQRSPERYEKRSLETGRPDRIRITGRLGLTEDDKCVLKCDATLNDQPILTQFQGADYALLPPCYQACNEQFRSSRKQRDVKVQAKESPMGARFYSGSATGKESQGTQVDFQMVLSTASSRREDSGRGKVKQQCACVSTADNVSDMYENKEDTSIAIKKNHSPLIVISVYSKNDSPGQTSTDIKPKNTISMEHKKDIKKIGRSRSPSPAKNSKRIVDKKSESRVNASTSKKTVRETARKVTRTKLSQTQSRSMVRSTSAKTKTENRTVKSKSPKAQKTPPQSRRSSSPQTKQEEPNITEQMKKALIEDFTKSYTEQMQRKAHLEIPLQTKHNVSNITIDIEGDSDYYNVKLEQDVGMNTELTVRKPPRGSRPRADNINMSAVGETDTTSLENFLYMPENEARKRSFSQTLMFDGTDLTMNSEHEDAKALNVKDSIEVSHRRETKASVHVNDFYVRTDIPKEVDTNYLAQTKHFQGDDCSISNPVTRDREIQKLLGIDKGVKRSSQATKPSQLFDATGKNIKVRTLSENYNNTVIWTRKTKTENDTNDLTTHSLYDVVNTVILIRPLHRMACNENIQLLHQLSLRRPKPVILTRRQYDKVKRIIYHSVLAKHNSYLARSYYNERRLRNFKLQIVKSNTEMTILHYDKNSQTDNVVIDHACATISEANTYIVRKTICGDAGGDNGNDKINSSSVTFVNSNNNNCTQQVINVNNYYSHNVRTIFIARDHVKHSYNEIKKEHLAKTASVKDIQYRRMAIKKQRVRFSSSDSANYIPKACVEKKDSCSVHTIFKCHQKSITPNLGTSANSLCVSSENIDSRFKFSDDSLHDIKPKKAFLKRLISCLVFKSSPPVSQTRNPKGLIENGSPTSSFDSYHVSTSLGAIEMSSSLYDTSASFYSDHTTRCAKTKGGFFSAVRGLLSRKNCS